MPWFGSSLEIGMEKVQIGNLGLDFHWKLVRKRSKFAIKCGPDLVLFLKIFLNIIAYYEGYYVTGLKEKV